MIWKRNFLATIEILGVVHDSFRPVFPTKWILPVLPSEQPATSNLALVRYMRIVAYTAVQGVYVFVFIGVLRTIFDIAVAELQKDGMTPPKTNMSPKKGPFQKERIVFQPLSFRGHVSF